MSQRDGWQVPPSLATRLTGRVAEGGRATGTAWLADLPRAVAEQCEGWRLKVRGPARHGHAALVLPVVRDDGSPAALKLTWPHPEARHEHLALRAWDGRGAVRLLAADPARWALLLEWLEPDHSLDRLGPLASCRALGDLLAALDRPALPRTETLTGFLETFAGDVDRALAAPERTGVPRRLLVHGRSLAAQLLRAGGLDGRLVHTDLHGQNVLRRPGTTDWVAIGPKPLAGIPEFGLAPALWNRWPEVVAADDPRGHLNARLLAACQAAGADVDLARALSLVRVLRTALWAVEEGGAGAREEVTVAVTIAKAMQPD